MATNTGYAVPTFFQFGKKGHLKFGFEDPMLSDGNIALRLKAISDLFFGQQTKIFFSMKNNNQEEYGNHDQKRYFQP
jgi:hypothetical protein